MDKETAFRFSGQEKKNGRRDDRRKEEKDKEPEEKGRVKLFLIIGIVGIVVYIALLAIQGRMLERHKEPTEAVYTAAVSIPENTHITKENVDDYFVLADRVKTSLPEGFIGEKQKADLLDTFLSREYAEKDVVTQKGLSKIKDIRKSIENPIEISFGVTNLAQVVGGTIRAGDRINIYSIRETEQGAKTKAEAGTEAGSGAEAGAEAEAEAGTGAEYEAEDEDEAEAGTEAEDEAGTGTGAGTGEKTETGKPTDAAAGTESGTESETGGVTLVTSGTKKSYECVEIFTNAFVTSAYTAAGDAIKTGKGEELEAPTTVINVLIPMSAEKDFNLALENGTVRVSRICR